MLLKFYCENFRSFKNRAEITFEKKAISEVETLDIGVLKNEFWEKEVLPITAIYGANAAGKTNLIRALDHLMYMIQVNARSNLDSMPQSYSKLLAQDFKFQEASGSGITKFGIEVLLDDVLFIYDLEITKHRVVRESLLHKASSGINKHGTKLFNREIIDGNLKIIFDSKLDKFSDMQINETTPALSILFNFFDVPEVKKLKSWASGFQYGMGGYRELQDRVLIHMIEKQSLFSTSVLCDILNQFDFGIFNLSVEQSTAGKTIFVHRKINNINYKLNFQQESKGTRAILRNLIFILSSLKEGKILVFDEISNHLHPAVTKSILNLYRNRATNPKGGQLIFTTHDAGLMRGDLLRRDEIWLVDKDNQTLSSEITRLTDYKPRNDLALDRAYLDGRFNAIPLIESDMDLEIINKSHELTK